MVPRQISLTLISLRPRRLCCMTKMSFSLSRELLVRPFGLEKVGDEGSEAIDDRRHALFVGMKPVGLVQIGFPRDPLEEEGVERHAMLLRKPRVDRIEGGLKLRAPI